MEEQGLFCLYPNLPNKHAFVSSWNEVGEHDSGDMGGKRSSPLQQVWGPECEKIPSDPVRLDHDGIAVKYSAKEPYSIPHHAASSRSGNAPSLPKSSSSSSSSSSAIAYDIANLTASGVQSFESSGHCDLSGVNFIFDSVIYHAAGITIGKPMGGVAKMWHNILPFMIKVIKEAGTKTRTTRSINSANQPLTRSRSKT
jgi:hypothetical protein